MTSTGLTTLAFLRRAHRRRVMWRCVEGAGIGALIGAAVASATMGLFAWRGVPDDVFAACIVLNLLGLLAGIIVSLRRLPSMLDTAIDVDRQLGTPDLLSSALSMLHRTDFTDAAFAETVLAFAEVRVRDVTLARLVARRLGPRAWAAIGLAIAGVFTVAMMTAAPRATQAAAEKKPASGSSAAPLGSEISSPSTGTSWVQHGSGRADHVTPSSGGGPDDQGEDSRHAAPDPTSSTDAARHMASSDASGPGRGGDDTRRETRDSGLASRPDSSVAPQNPQDHVAGGNGAVSTDAASGSASPGIVRSKIGAQRPPWHSSSWQTDRARALESLDRGAVPDRYRDLVRDYFTR